MRSAVSVILSGTAPTDQMSYPDYEQTPHDHSALLVVVRQIGRQLRTKQFSRAFDRISRVNQVKINDSQGNPRLIWIRYLRGYPAENNDWGDFQTHRKALGLISVGQCNSQEEFSELCRIHESLKVGYAFTLFDSRLILFGLNPDGSVFEGSQSPDVSPCGDQEDEGGGGDGKEDRDATDRSVPPGEDMGSLGSSSLSNASKNGGAESPRNSMGSMNASVDESEATDDTSEDTTTTSKSGSGGASASVPYQNMKEGDVPAATATSQTEGRSQSRNSTESKNSLIAPSNFKARTLFYSTMDQSQNLETDVMEFISSLFWILESKRVDKLALKKADSALLISSLCAPFEKKDFVGLDLESKNNKRRADGRLKKQLGDLSLQAGLPAESITHYHASSEILKSVNDWLWLAGALEGLCSASVCYMYPHLRRALPLHRNSSLQGTDMAKYKHLAANSLPVDLSPDQKLTSVRPPIKNCLSPQEILDKYRESVTHYGKYRQAGIIETEASIKAALVLIEQKQTLAAAEFLQNAVFISLQLTEDEKMHRFCALSDLYARLGFHRKAAFFKRVAAMRCVSPHNPHPNWALCHSLLLQLIDGYKISLNPNDRSIFGFYGWPRLQMQVLQELVGTAKRKGNNALATKHMTLLLHTMLPHMTRDERREFSQQLEMLAKEAEGLPVPLAIDNGMIIPPVNLTLLPYVKMFKLIPPTPHLKAMKKEVKKPTDDISPFVYTPINRDLRVKDVTKSDFSWVEGELCEVNVVVENPLPVELKVASMCLITEGAKFHVNSNGFSIPAESSAFSTTLTGRPLEPGVLRIIGYSTYTLGVKSNIRLKSLRNMPFPYVDVEVVPELPALEIQTSKPRSDCFSSLSNNIIASANICALMGESQECTVTLTNVGKLPIELLELELDAQGEKKAFEIFKWSDDNILSQLPIQPGASASFTIYVYGAGDFIGQPGSNSGDNSSLSSLPTAPSSISDGPSSLPSRLGAFSDRILSKRTDSSVSNKSSIRSFMSSASPALPSTRSSKSLPVTSYAKNYEAVLKLKYSGGPGLQTGHFRTCGVSLNVEVFPSVVITKWDTLPGDSPSQFYLVLDIFNVTQHEMEIHYAKTKQILVEKDETCRIPVPVDRCPLTNVEKGKEETACCDHVVTNVDLKWILPESNGKATLHGIRLTRSMIQLVTVSPIQWEITLNGEHVKPEEMRFESGEMINVNVWLRNHMPEPLENLNLSLDCFQDYQNGRINNRLESRFAVVGNDSVLIPKIAPGSCFQHSLCLMFFVGGLYKVDFKCNRKDVDEIEWKYNPPLDLMIN